MHAPRKEKKKHRTMDLEKEGIRWAMREPARCTALSCWLVIGQDVFAGQQPFRRGGVRATDEIDASA